MCFKFISIIILLSSVISVSSCKKNHETSSVVRIGIQPSAAFIPLYIARDKGFIEDALAPKKIDVVWQDFESGPPMNESLAADMTDIGVIGDVPTVIALSNSTPMKLVGIPARGANAYALLASGNNTAFSSSKDLKTKKIATVFGSTGHNFTTLLLKKYGLTFSDIEFINISAKEAESSLTSGLADAVVIWEPNITRLVANSTAKIIAYGSETPLKGTNGFVCREEFLETNRDTVAVILNEYEKAASLIPELDEGTLAKIAAKFQVSGEQIKSISNIYDFSVSITNEDIESLQDTISFLVDIGNLTKPYNIESKIEYLK